MPTRPREARDSGEHRSAVARLAGELYAERVGPLRAIARSLLGAQPQEIVDDTIQSALLAFIRSFPGDPADREGAWRYLAVAVRSAAWKHHRTASRKDARPIESASLGELAEHAVRPAPHSADPAPNPLEVVIEREQIDEQRHLLAALPAEQRHCLLLGASGLPIREIAEALGLSERQVRKRIEKGNRRICELKRDGA